MKLREFDTGRPSFFVRDLVIITYSEMVFTAVCGDFEASKVRTGVR